VDGLVVPDLIPEEAGPFRAALDRRGIHLIALVAPTTPPRRQKWIAEQSRGFLYAVSLTGVTGSRRGVAKEVPAFLQGLRRVSPVPVAVGFGIATGVDAHRLAPSVDGVIVGSALMQRLIKKQSVVSLARELRSALN
jgi:tryptophan synthase alpha chain